MRCAVIGTVPSRRLLLLHGRGPSPQSVVSRVLRIVRVAGSQYTIDTHGEEYQRILSTSSQGDGETSDCNCERGLPSWQLQRQRRTARARPPLAPCLCTGSPTRLLAHAVPAWAARQALADPP